MKKLLLILLVMSALMLLTVPGIFASVTDPVIGGTLGVTITTEQFPPQVWGCDNRIVYDDSVEPGRISPGGTELVERINNYAFEGEQIQWKVLAMDKNGIEKIGDVYVTVGDGNGGNTETTVKQNKVTYCGNIPSTSTDWNKSISLPKYDPSLGNLTGVTLELGAGLSSDMKIEHTGNTTPAQFRITVNGNVTLNFSDVYMQTNTIFNRNGNATVFDGKVDYNGTSGITFPTISNFDTLTKNSSHFSDFVRTVPGERFNVSVKANSVFQINGPSNYDAAIVTNANATACVTYTYETEQIIIIPGDGNIEANCVRDSAATEGTIDPSCNARIDEETLTEFDPSTMAYYTCTLTVETPDSQDGAFYGKKDVTVEATDLDGEVGTMAEVEQWFFNPVIQLDVEGKIAFSKVRPGTSSYSGLVTVGNDADSGSGVLLDMFVSGTDFSDSSSSGAMCPTTNQLSLSAFNYYATSGAYSTHTDSRADSEGYVPIKYGIGFNNPNPFYGNNEIIKSGVNYQGYQAGNILSPGADISLILRLNLPEPCNGNFNTGQIYFWGEAI